MLQVIGAAPGHKTEINWPEVWRESDEKRRVKKELETMKANSRTAPAETLKTENEAVQQEFASTYQTQLIEVIKRVAQFYWRNPTYIYSKLILVVGTASPVDPLGAMFEAHARFLAPRVSSLVFAFSKPIPRASKSC